MALHDTRFTPRQPGWRRDLPERDAPPASKCRPFISQSSIRYMDGRFIEITTDENNARGVSFALFVLGIFLFLFTFVFCFHLIFVAEWDSSFALLLPVMLSILFFAVPYLIILTYKTGISNFKCRPIIFDRMAGKVYIHSQEILTNKPLSRWPAKQWVCSWDMVQAEIQGASGFNGVGYQIRYLTLLTICKSGTNEVIERLVLTGDEDPGFWEYLRLFMEHGPEGLPRLYIPNLEPSFKENFFHYMRNLDPGERGRAERKQEGGLVYTTIPPNLLLFPMFAVFGIGQHIALKLAPKAKWSPEIAEELKAAGYQGPSIKE